MTSQLRSPGSGRSGRLLPHESDGAWFVTDGGLETVLVFHDGVDLPAFAAFPLLDSVDGRSRLERYFADFVAIAAATGATFVAETPTWRANPNWGAELGYSREGLATLNRQAVAFMSDIRDRVDDPAMVVSGNIGPRGDGYVPDATMSIVEAADYHSAQVEAFADSGADMVTAMTINTVEEAAGIATAAARVDMPMVVSFTVETDGCLPSGSTLREAIERTDEATGGSVAYFMVNCAHPNHFRGSLDDVGPWRDRIGGVRANASTLSHAELDEAVELDDGDPDDLADRYGDLAGALPGLRVVGGCCGTDHRHVDAIARRVTGMPTP